MLLEERKAKAELLHGREARTISGTEVRASVDGSTITLDGYASVTETPYDMGWYQERIATGAFQETLSKQPDCQLLINHEGLPLARTGRNMTLTEDDRGLHVQAELDANDPDVQRLATKMQSGLIDQMSFAFRVMKQTWDEDYTDRCITEVSIDRGDVSVVNQGASPTTFATLRSLFTTTEFSDDEIEQMRDDPAIITIVRRLNIPAFEGVAVEQAEGIAETAPPSHSLSLYQARAHALSLRK